jgi:dihydroorotate dehydrogenase electron transfer subunit
MPFDTPAPVLRHDALKPDHFLLTLECPAVAREARAGQFVMLQTRPGFDPLLRRPMSICRVLPGRRGRIQILYKVVGEGTRYLSRRVPGDVVPTLGPLGNGFRMPPSGTRPILVSGGIGIAIFPFLVEALRAARGTTPLLVYGARSRRDLVALDFFRKARVPMRLATEDGSAGTKGFVTRLLEPLLEREGGRGLEIFACGPTPMLKAVGDLTLRASVPCQLALESQMPCGIGICLGCVTPCPPDERGPIFRRVCTEGPVFRPGEVVL